MSDTHDSLNDSVEFLSSVECYRKSKAFHKSFSDIQPALQRSEEEHESQRRHLFHLLSCSLSEERHTRGKELVDIAKSVSERLSVLDRLFRRLIILPLNALGEDEMTKIQNTKKRLETLRHPSRSSAEGTSGSEAVLQAKQQFLEALDMVENKRRVITEENLRLFLAEELRVMKEVTQILEAEVCTKKEPEKEGIRLKCQPCADDADKMCCVVLPAGGSEEMEELSPPGLLVKRIKKVSFIERKSTELPPFSHGPPELNDDQLKQFCEECEEHCPPSAVHCRAVCAASASGCPADVKATAARVLGSEAGCIAQAIRQIEKARGISRMEEDQEEQAQQHGEGSEERMASGKLHGGSGKRERVPSISIHPPEEEGQGSAEVVPSAHSNVSASSASSPAISPDSDTSPYAADGPATQIDREGERDKSGDLADSPSSTSKPGQYLTQPFPPPLLRQKARMPLPLPLSDEEEEEFLRKNQSSSSSTTEGIGSATPKTSGDSESASGKGEEDTSGLGKLNGGSGKGAATAKSQGSEGQPSVSGASVKPIDSSNRAEAAPSSGPGPSVPEPTETPPPLDRVNEMVSEPRGPPFNDYPNQKKGAPSSATTTNTTSSVSSSSSTSDPEDRGEATMKGGHLRGGSGKGHSSTSTSAPSSSVTEGHSTQSKNVPTSHSSAILSPVKSMIQGLTKAEEAAAEALWNMEDRVVSAVSELVETGEITSTDHDARQEKESAQQEARVKNADELTKHPWPQGSHSQRK